ncbi:ABC transporter substrate-binding protein [Falsarthrobacter nasiphocae]|uniref:Peptide/nickel transport system substrate-binding protein n=1 Tax=Falsarthrobacter nasiphocae TaxID=189863 RepID=A0AAE4C6P7_9MICC|nr:ABC transporter substrate-binding protein [Falsarthrobacter nasiphocae]MDR6892808.1 peptide/nickel transport system substrate-binding protein [Falsarthrobacter nasiphocae]
MTGAERPHRDQVTRRLFLGGSLALAAGPALAACAPKVVPPSDSRPAVERRLRFGLPAPIASLDPALANDIESQRVIRQAVQTLVGTDAATGAPTPLLAESFSIAESGDRVRFTLRSGLVFHDGSPLTPAAVRDTFERLYRLPEQAVALNPANAFRAVFRAHAHEGESSLYEGCDILGERVLELKLRRPIAGIIPALSHIGFGVLSPAQTRERVAQATRLETTPESCLPVGTGPFTVQRATTKAAALARFTENSQAPIAVTGIDFSVHPEEWSRLDALLTEKVDVIDLVTPRMAASLARNAKPTLTRDPYSLLYLGMNAAHPVLAKPRIRRIVADLISKQPLIPGQFLNGTKVADSFFPPRLRVRNPQRPAGERPVTADDAPSALKDAGYKGETIEFVYPTGAPRLYLPYPERTYALLARQLQAAGLNIKPVPIPWTAGYEAQMLARRQRGFHLGGLNGGFLDPGYFVTALFLNGRAEFGVADADLTEALQRAQVLTDADERLEAYGDIGDRLAVLAPAVPLVVPVSALATSPDVQGVPASPVLDEVLSSVRYT